MAKSSRSSTRKTNNQRLKAKVFGPIEAARAERLSARLLELAAQPKPPKPESDDIKIVDAGEEEATIGEDAVAANVNDNVMDIDSVKPTSAKRSDKKRIEKRRTRSKIVFPKYGDKKKTKKR
ncbi:hypothetical protein F4781DRAFT_431555 [Annulohypoxylon bovei var. microspora]|nr:hypothetical protein F4781DRAFT_431555 [Annulohypoxylon bovei var. microspora]